MSPLKLIALLLSILGLAAMFIGSLSLVAGWNLDALLLMSGPLFMVLGVGLYFLDERSRRG